MKNLNSFREIVKAIDSEEKRQIEILENGSLILQETRRWDEDTSRSYSMRSKEKSQDYRYFSEPDLYPLVITDDYIASIKAKQPELAQEKRLRYRLEFQLPPYDIDILIKNKYLAILFEKTVALSKNPKKTSNWIMGETLRLLKEENKEPKDIIFSPENLAKLILISQAGELTSTVAKDVFYQIFKENVDPEMYIRENALSTIHDFAFLEKVVEEIIGEYPQSVKDFHNGKEKVVGYLVGNVMKQIKGKGNPKIITKIIEEKLKF